MLLDHKTSHVCLLDLSAAFDTNDHNIIITHLSSWFGVHSSVVNWIKFYFLSHSLHIKFENELSSLHTFCSSVPHGSVLGPLLFIMYTTPLSSLISSLSLNNHLYADDTQLFFSFHPPDTDSSITHLQDALQQTSCMMTTNILTQTPLRLNSCSSDLKKNLLKYTIPQLTPPSWLTTSVLSLTI